LGNIGILKRVSFIELHPVNCGLLLARTAVDPSYALHTPSKTTTHINQLRRNMFSKGSIICWLDSRRLSGLEPISVFLLLKQSPAFVALHLTYQE
jgi:hypothetical protein